MADVMVVEDERDIRDLLRRYLERAGHSVVTTGSGAQALAMLASAPPDLVLLDLGLPDIDGIEVLTEAKGTRAAVIVLTARTAVEDRLRGLQLGADDYVTKPFSPQEVVLRVSAVLGRGGPRTAGGPVSYGGGRLDIDAAAHRAHLDGVELDLTPTEWGILLALAEVPGRAYTREELINRARGFEFAGYERTIDSHVKNLRAKLGADGSQIVETVLSVGYRLGWARDG